LNCYPTNHATATTTASSTSSCYIKKRNFSTGTAQQQPPVQIPNQKQPTTKSGEPITMFQPPKVERPLTPITAFRTTAYDRFMEKYPLETSPIPLSELVSLVRES